MTDETSSKPSGIFRGILTLGGGEIVARAIAFVATALLTRRLGPEAFGIVGFATGLCWYLTLAVNSGLGEVGAREVARQPRQAAHLYATIVGLRLLLAAAAAIVLFAVVVVLPKPPLEKLVILCTGLSFFSLAIDPSWVYKGLERTAAAAAFQLGTQIVYVIAIVVLVSGPGDVAMVPVAQFSGELVLALVLGVPVLAWGSRRFSWREGRSLLASAGYLSAARVLRTLILTFDVVYLGFTVAPRELGLYTASYRFCYLVMAIAGAISAAYLPSFTRATSQPSGNLQPLLNGAVRMAGVIGAPIVFGALVTAGPLLTTLFGASFAPAAPAFVLLVIGIAFVFLHSLTANVFLVAHRTDVQAKVYGLAAAANIGLNLFLIPRYGILGAAAATLVAEALIAILGLVAIARLGFVVDVRVLAAPLAAAAAMGAGVLALSQYPLAVQLAAGVAIYGGILAWMPWRRWLHETGAPFAGVPSPPLESPDASRPERESPG